MSDDQDPPRRPADPEGVRIIGADEAEAALEREDVARRRGPDEPRPGDRPGPPPEDAPEPVLRFPLSSGTNDPGAEGGDLPHWSDPPTGEYGAVGGGNIFDEPSQGTEREWSAFSSSAPRWRDSGDSWGDEEDVSNWGDEDTRVGALDERERDPEDFFSFDEFEEPVPPPAPGASVYAEADQTAGGYYDEAGNYVEDYSEEIADDFEDGDERKIVIGGGRFIPGAPRTRVPPPAATGTDRDLGQAAIVGGALFVAALVLFAIGPWAALLLVTLTVTAAAAEFFTKLREVGREPAALLGVAASAFLPVAAYHRGTDGIAVGMFVVTVAAMLWFLIGAGEKGATHNIGLTVLGVAWIGMFGAFGGAILAVQGGEGIGNPGIGILFGAILATIAYDIGGLFVGRSAGTRPISAASPNKTVEGLAGGCIAALTIAIVYGVFVEPFGGFGDGLKLGLAVAVAAPIGDLCQSMIKRDLGLKDMGSILPGHGGFTDRFDGMLFVLPTVYFVARLSDFFL